METYARNHNEIMRQGELNRTLRLYQGELDRDLRASRTYRLLPYYAVTLAFIGFLITLFL